MCGLPGSGKSTYLKQLKNREIPDSLPIEQVSAHIRRFTPTENSVIICPDEFRLVLTGKIFYAPAEDSVWSHVKTMARICLKQDRPIIIDATNLTPGNRATWLRIGKEMGVEVDCWWVEVSPKTARKRNKLREAIVPDDVMDRMEVSAVTPSKREGFQHIDIISE